MALNDLGCKGPGDERSRRGRHRVLHHGHRAGQRYLGLVNSIPTIARDLRIEYTERSERGIHLPRTALERALAHVRSLIAPAAASPFGLPADFVVSPDSAWRVNLSRDVAAAINERINPALESLVSWLEGERDRAPDEIGLVRLPGGGAYYETLLRYYSTVDVTPTDAHAIGLREVSRLNAEVQSGVLNTIATAEAYLAAPSPEIRQRLAALATETHAVRREYRRLRQLTPADRVSRSAARASRPQAISASSQRPRPSSTVARSAGARGSSLAASSASASW